MTDHGRTTYRRNLGRWWRQAIGRSNRVIESIYMNLRSRASLDVDEESLATLGRNVASESVRCIDPAFGETGRNMRDFIILMNAITITEHFRHMFVLYARHRMQYLINQVGTQQQESVRQGRSLRYHHQNIRRPQFVRKNKKRRRRKPFKLHHYRNFVHRKNSHSMKFQNRKRNKNVKVYKRITFSPGKSLIL